MTRSLRLASVLTCMAACLLPGAARAGAQARARVPTDSLVRDAMSRAALGDTASALELLEQATDQSPRDVDALYWRGLLLTRTTFLRLGDVPRNVLAWHLLSRAADIDPKNPRYLIEMGRIRLYTPLLRVEAERLFKKAMRVATESGEPSQIADVAWELGQIKERRYQTARDRYMITSPGLMYEIGVAMQQKHYTEEFLTQHSRPIENVGSVDRFEAEEYYRQGLAALPTHEGNAVGLLGLLYDQKRFQEMRQVARPFLDAGSGSARLRFGAGLAAYRLGDLRDAEKLFDEALTRLTAEQRRDAVGLDRIIRRRDAAAYDALSPADRAQTDSAYWEAADPMLSTPENEGRLEFLARLALADLRYSDADMRQTGWRTDRGLILLRYGEPPTVATFAPMFAADAADAVGRITTIWYYPKEKRQFVFMGPPAMNYASFAGDMRGVAEEQREDAPFLLDNVPFAASIDTLPVQIAQLRGRTPGQSQLIVAAAVDTRQLYEAAEIDRSALAMSLRVGPPSRLRVTNADTVPVTLPATTTARRVWTQSLPNGAYRVRVEAQDVAVQGAGARAQTELALGPRAATVFQLSDLIIADRIEAPATPLAGFAESGIAPRGNLSLAQREVFSVYWENYGMRPDAEGRVRFEIKVEVTLLEIDRSNAQVAARFLGNVADAVGLTKEGEEQLGVRFERQEPLGARDRVPQIVTLGLGSAPAGRYRLQLIVTDRNSGSVARSERIFQLARP